MLRRSIYERNYRSLIYLWGYVTVQKIMNREVWQRRRDCLRGYHSNRHRFYVSVASLCIRRASLLRRELTSGVNRVRNNSLMRYRYRCLNVNNVPLLFNFLISTILHVLNKLQLDTVWICFLLSNVK